MRNLILILLIILAGSISFAENVQNGLNSMPVENTIKETDENKTLEKEEVKSSKEKTKEDDTMPKPDYTTVIKGEQIFYYDKEGKFFARDKKIKEQTFFYNKTGQLTGKSTIRGEKTYYYNALNKFLGVCDENECFDSEMTSTGKIPPLPKIKTFTPYVNPDILNPKQQENKLEEE